MTTIIIVILLSIVFFIFLTTFCFVFKEIKIYKKNKKDFWEYITNYSKFEKAIMDNDYINNLLEQFVKKELNIFNPYLEYFLINIVGYNIEIFYNFYKKLNENEKNDYYMKYLHTLSKNKDGVLLIKVFNNTPNNNKENEEILKKHPLLEKSLNIQKIELNKINKFCEVLYNSNLIKKNNITNSIITKIIIDKRDELLKTYATQMLSNCDCNINQGAYNNIKKIIHLYPTSNENAISMYLFSLYKSKTDNYFNSPSFYLDEIQKAKKEEANKQYLNNLLLQEDEQTFSITDTDLMTGQQFEIWVSELFNKLGFQTELTKTSGDQGIDIIAQKNSIKYAIQTKRYSKPVGNHAIMEAVAGAKLYKATGIIVITNNFFTKSAKILAQANNVILWDRNILEEKINTI